MTPLNCVTSWNFRLPLIVLARLIVLIELSLDTMESRNYKFDELSGRNNLGGFVTEREVFSVSGDQKVGFGNFGTFVKAVVGFIIGNGQMCPEV